MSKEFVDVLVIGAGPSGCVSSSYLKKNNVNVKVVEKTKFPRLVVGESLIPRVMDHFDEVDQLGLSPLRRLGLRFKRPLIGGRVVAQELQIRTGPPFVDLEQHPF